MMRLFLPPFRFGYEPDVASVAILLALLVRLPHSLATSRLQLHSSLAQTNVFDLGGLGRLWGGPGEPLQRVAGSPPTLHPGAFWKTRRAGPHLALGFPPGTRVSKRGTGIGPAPTFHSGTSGKRWRAVPPRLSRVLRIHRGRPDSRNRRFPSVRGKVRRVKIMRSGPVCAQGLGNSYAFTWGWH